MKNIPKKLAVPAITFESAFALLDEWGEDMLPEVPEETLALNKISEVFPSPIENSDLPPVNQRPNREFQRTAQEELNSWIPYRRALRRHDQEPFDKVFDHAKLRMKDEFVFTRCVESDALIMGALIGQQNQLKKIEAQINAFSPEYEEYRRSQREKRRLDLAERRKLRKKEKLQMCAPDAEKLQVTAEKEIPLSIKDQNVGTEIPVKNLHRWFTPEGIRKINSQTCNDRSKKSPSNVQNSRKKKRNSQRHIKRNSSSRHFRQLGLDLFP